MTADATKPTSEAQAQAVPMAPAKPKAPKWDVRRARAAARRGIKKFAKPLADFIARDVERSGHALPGHRLPVRRPRLRQVHRPDRRVR